MGVAAFVLLSKQTKGWMILESGCLFLCYPRLEEWGERAPYSQPLFVWMRERLGGVSAIWRLLWNVGEEFAVHSQKQNWESVEARKVTILR